MQNGFDFAQILRWKQVVFMKSGWVCLWLTVKQLPASKLVWFHKISKRGLIETLSKLRVRIRSPQGSFASWKFRICESLFASPRYRLIPLPLILIFRTIALAKLCMWWFIVLGNIFILVMLRMFWLVLHYYFGEKIGWSVISDLNQFDQRNSSLGGAA